MVRKFCSLFSRLKSKFKKKPNTAKRLTHPSKFINTDGILFLCIKAKSRLSQNGQHETNNLDWVNRLKSNVGYIRRCKLSNSIKAKLQSVNNGQQLSLQKKKTDGHAENNNQNVCLGKVAEEKLIWMASIILQYVLGACLTILEASSAKKQLLFKGTLRA